jgi:hypothetical protein
VNTQHACSGKSTLFEAAFWVFVRQDIYAALVSQRPMKADLSACQVDLDFDSVEADDCMWANWIVWLVADIISFYFRQPCEEHFDISRWEVLKAKVEEWMAKKPRSFDPIYYRYPNPDEGRHFPHIYVSQPWHSISPLQGGREDYYANILYSCWFTILPSCHDSSSG